MRTHDDMVEFHVENQNEIEIDKFNTKEELVLHMIHSFAYERAASLCYGKVVLDLGCNVGYGSRILSLSAEKVIGVDVSQKSIQSAKERFESINLEFFQIDGKTLPFEDDTFDLVVSCQVIEHIVDYDQYIGEICRILKPNGIVLFTTPNSLIRLDPGMKPWYEFHVREFTPNELNETLKLNFSNVKIYGLVAEEPIHSIELNRVTALKNYAKFGEKPPGLSEKIKGLLPDRTVEVIRRLKHKLLNGSLSSGVTSDAVSIENILSSEFYYSCDKPDSWLDLLAVCSNRNGSLDALHHTLSEKHTLSKGSIAETK